MDQKVVTEDILRNVINDGLFFAATMAAEEGDTT
jgi:hypothetical protein